jgi:hypothetical protein
MTEWTPGQAKAFAGQVKLKKTYYTINEQSDHASTYGPAQTISEHVFTGRSLVTGQAMTDGRTSALALCRNQGPVYDERPQVARNSTSRRDAAKDFDKRARGLFGGKR